MTAIFEHTAPGNYRLAGSLSLTQGLRGLSLAPLELHDGVAVVDVEGVKTADSLLLAVLLEWDRAARRQGGAVHLTGISPRLNALMRVTGLSGLFVT